MRWLVRLSREPNSFFNLETNLWRGGRVAEGNGLLNRRMGLTYTEGSNPSLSAIPKASEY